MMNEPIHGSVDDAHTILGVREDYFTRDFKEYIRKEQLNWSRFDISDYYGLRGFGWVFWSQLDNFADLFRQALQKLIGVSRKELDYSLVQFWAATKTSEGRTLLTTQFQPFALGTTTLYASDERKRLCSYRMGMCREYNNSFYADAECAQELLGLPGRVFLNQLPESTTDVKHYSLEEYPQRDLALRCEISGSLAFPVFEHSSHTCVGVLEIVSPHDIYWHGEEFLGSMYDIFQEFGLLCLNGYKHHKMQLGQMDQPPMDAINNGMNVIKRNILVVPSSKERKRKMQDRKHKKAGVRIEVSLEEILKCSNMKREYAARELKVSVSTFKRVCRDYDIHRWPPRNTENANPFQPLPVENQRQIPQLNSDLPSNQALVGVSHIKPGFQDANMVTIRAKYENNNIKFRLPLSSRFVELQEEVTKRLNLEAGTYYVKYKDEEDELILITCDEDLQDWMHTSRSVGKISVVVLLELKQPITNLNPGLFGGQQTLFSPLHRQGLQSAEGELSIVPTVHTTGGVWLDAHFSYTPTIDEEETINKCMQDGSFRGEFVDGCWISNITVMEYSEMLDHYLSHCHFFGPNVVKNFKKSGRLLNTILLPKTEKIFFPILRDRHWMLLVIDVKKKYFLWLDSMRCEREKKYSEDFAHFLNHEFVFKRLTEQNEWPIKYPENTPIQDNGNDCGVYMMAYMISLAVGDKLPQFSQAQAKRMRRTICLGLKKWDIIPQCPLVDYNFLYIQERKKNEALNEKLHKESTAASRDEVFLVSETTKVFTLMSLLRCGKSCRLRWMNYLRLDIKRGNFSREEEESIIKLHQILGNRWSAIATRLPGRTDNEIKNFWHTCLKKKLQQIRQDTDTTITPYTRSRPVNFSSHLTPQDSAHASPVFAPKLIENMSSGASSDSPVVKIKRPLKDDHTISFQNAQEIHQKLVARSNFFMPGKFMGTVLDPRLRLSSFPKSTTSPCREDGNSGINEDMDFWLNLLKAGDQSQNILEN